MMRYQCIALILIAGMRFGVADQQVLIMVVVGSGGEVLWCVTLIPKVKKSLLFVLIPT
jgi:hypothetical protein